MKGGALNGGTVDRAVVQVTVGLVFHAQQPLTVEQFQAKAAALVDELMSAEARDSEVTDTTTYGDAAGKEMIVEMLVLSDDQFHAVMKVLTIIRAAIHTIGDGTPRWPKAKDVALAISLANVQAEPKLISVA